MAFFEAYFDESGTHEDSSVTAFGGVIASQSEWDPIMSAWLKVLANHGVPRMHANELANLRGPFRGWDDDRRKRLVNDLLDVYRDHEICLIGTAVENSVYDSIRAEFPGQRLNAYGFCCWFSIGHLILLADEAEDSKVSVTLESGPYKNVQPIQVLQQGLISKEVQDSLGFCAAVYANKATHRQLELADVVAYDTYKYYSRELEGHTEPRYSLKRLAEESVNRIGIMPEDGIRKALKRFAWFKD